jgi:hypothetical protein
MQSTIQPKTSNKNHIWKNVEVLHPSHRRCELSQLVPVRIGFPPPPHPSRPPAPAATPIHLPFPLCPSPINPPPPPPPPSAPRPPPFLTLHCRSRSASLVFFFLYMPRSTHDTPFPALQGVGQPQNSRKRGLTRGMPPGRNHRASPGHAFSGPDSRGARSSGGTRQHTYGFFYFRWEQYVELGDRAGCTGHYALGDWGKRGGTRTIFVAPPGNIACSCSARKLKTKKGNK